MAKSINVEMDFGSQTVSIAICGTAERLYDKWQETLDDDDFEAFADWIHEDVLDAMDIEITGAWE